ncbi:MAG TPA: hypothetical protein PK509_09360 [Catalimonadaceae bacterium]|nr:hypothetical protein [Catalimonadaceae bacterium]HPI09703.1 hypothetical protein [Catalimonadaceae bacterium]
MKKSSFLLSLVLAVVFSVSTVFAGDKFASWPQIKAFHTVMSQTFHPSEEGNLDPIKKRSGEMVEMATALAAAPIPKEFNNKEVAAAVKKLEADSKALDKLIKAKGSDDDIKKSLAALHDTFHTIVEKCSPGDHHDEHEGHGHEGHNHK